MKILEYNRQTRKTDLHPDVPVDSRVHVGKNKASKEQ